jgi:VCBS repeat-containing protein
MLFDHGRKQPVPPVVEEYEPRLLYSADFASAGLALAGATPAVELRLIGPDGEFASGRGGEEAQSLRHELVFVDTRVSGYEALVGDIARNGQDGRIIETVIIDGRRDGVEQMTEALAGRSGIDAIHVIAHGTDGALYLGQTMFDTNFLNANGEGVARWGAALAMNADLLLYGCDIAGSDAGADLLRQLSMLTRADVAASTDATGHTLLGGNWNLEFSTAAIEAHLALSREAQDEWFGLLDTASLEAAKDTYIVSATNNNFGGSTQLILDKAGGSVGNQRVLLQFDLSAIPAGATINSATLQLEASAIGTTMNLNVYELLQTWTEGTGNGTAGVANWNQRVTGTNWTTAGGTFDATPAAMLNTNATGQHSWDITALVQAWIAGTKVNNGVLVGSPDSGGATVTYDSREGATAPVLVIDFTAASNVSPVLSGANDLADINEDDVTNAGTLVSDLIAGQVTDPDTGALSGIAVTAVDDSNGTWQYSTNGGSTWNSFGAVSITSARLLAADAGTYVRFVPDVDFNGTVANGLTFRAWDQTSGAAGAAADTTATTSSTVLDNFGTVSYSNNDGTALWSTGWVDVDGNPGAGNIRISGGQLVFDASLLNSDTIYREANLNGALGATLSFSYNNVLALLSSVDLQISDNGGASYTTLATFSASSNTGAGTFSTDISAYIAIDTRIRFAMSGVLLGNTLSVDDIEISYLTSAFSVASAGSSIVVNSVNNAPAGVDNTVATLEDTDYTFATADFGFTDPNDSPADALLSVKFTSLPGAGTLTNNGVAVSAGQSVSVADIGAGLLKFTPDAEASGTGYASFTFQVQDDGGTANGGVDLDPVANTLTIDVTAVNNAPAGVDNTVATLEDTDYTFAAADFGFTDPNDSPADALLNVKFTSLPGAGTLTNNGVAVSAGQSVSVADIGAGLLKFTPDAEASGTGYASFTFQVQDDGGTANGGVDLDPVANTLTIDVTAVNNAPVNTVPTIQGTNQDTTLILSNANANAISVGDVDAGGSPLQVTLTATNGTLTLPGTTGLSFSAGDGTADATMTFTGTLTDINAALDGLAFTPSAGFTGSASIQIATSDLGSTGAGGAQTDTDSVSILVNNVNDAPINTVPGAQSTSEDTALVFSSANGNSISIADPDAALNPVEVTLAVTNGTLTLSGISGLTFTSGDGAADATMTFTGTLPNINAALDGLSFTPTANFNGAALLTLTTDDQGNSGLGSAQTDADSVTITVASVADTPSVAGASTNEDAQSGSGLVITPNAGDGAEVTHYKITAITGGTLYLNDGVTLVSNGTFIIAADGGAGLKFTPAPDSTANGGFSVQASLAANDADLGGGVVSAVITVTAVNDAPILTLGSNQTVNEDAGAQVVAGFASAAAGGGTDETAQTFSYTIANDNNALFSAQPAIDASGELTYTAAANASGSATVTVFVTDSGGTANGGVDASAGQTFTITVNAMNDVAVIGGTSAGGVTEDAASPNLLASGTLTISDPDAGESSFVAQAATAGSYGTFAVDAAGNWSYAASNSQGAIQQLAAGATLSETFTVTSFDGSASQGVVITITGINDAPAAASDANSITKGSASVSGDVLANDIDVDANPAPDTLVVAQVNGLAANVGATVAGSFGSLTVNANGSYAYTLDNTLPAVQALAPGATLTDAFSYQVSDGNGGTATTSLTITINGGGGGNNVPLISGTTSGSVTEDGPGTTLTASGTLSITDPDPGQSRFAAQSGTAGSYGTFTVDASGSWSYSASNSQSAIQQLAAGATLSETFTVTSFDGSASQNIVITINGVNDAAAIGGTDSGSVTEDASTPDLVTSGTLAVSDPDTGESSFVAQAATAGSYGTFTLNAAGSWTYTANNSQSAIQQLAAGATLLETFSVASFDGTASHNVVVTIVGVDEPPVVVPPPPPDPGTPPPPAPDPGNSAPPETTPPVPNVPPDAAPGSAGSNETSPVATAPDAAPVASPVPPAATPPTDTPVEPAAPALLPPPNDQSATAGTTTAAESAPADIELVTTSPTSTATGDAGQSALLLLADNVNFRSAAVRHGAFLIRVAALSPDAFDTIFSLPGATLPASASTSAALAGAQNPSFLAELDRLRENVSSAAELEQRVVGTAVAVGTGLSVGYVIWLLRGGLLITSLLSSLPAWRFVDPLPILGKLQGDDEEDADQESLESMVGDGADDAGIPGRRIVG